MEIISTIAAPRTGSMFFQEHIKDIDGVTYNAIEFFNEWHRTHYTHINNIFIKHRTPFTESYYSFLEKILPLENKPYSSDNLKQSFYNFEMILDAINVLEQNNYQYFFHKVVRTNWFKPTDMFEKIINISDKIIILYRESILDVFISTKRAMLSHQWNNRTNDYKEKYDIEFTWNKDKFLWFSNHYINHYKETMESLDKNKKTFSIVCYEKLIKCDNQEKRFNMIHNALGSEHQLTLPQVKKQSRAVTQIEAFSNKEQFLSEYASIDEYHKILKLI